MRGIIKKKYFRMFIIEGTLMIFLSVLLFPFVLKGIKADVGGNVTMDSLLDIGASPPVIKNIDIEEGSVVLLINDSRKVNCTAEIEDFDTDDDILNVTAEFFDISSSYGGSDDNNSHYSNDTCYIDRDYGDSYTALAHCVFDVNYYANAGTWNCSVNVTDGSDYTDFNSSTTTVEGLLAVGLPDSLNYGEINATYVSDEGVLNVTNYGNVEINLSLSGYAYWENDGYAMNCSLGGNISTEYEKFNLTETTEGDLDLTEFENNYVNLTDTPTTREFNLNSREDDDNPDEAINSTYWRIYVPRSIGGTCSGNIVFGAIQEAES